MKKLIIFLILLFPFVMFAQDANKTESATNYATKAWVQEQISGFSSSDSSFVSAEIGTITEYSAGAGVTIDGVLLKDSRVYLSEANSSLLGIESDNDGSGSSFSTIRLIDNGTDIWSIRKASSNDFEIKDEVNDNVSFEIEDGGDIILDAASGQIDITDQDTLQVDYIEDSGNDFHLLGLDEDITPTRNLGQNDDGEVVYSEVAYGYFVERSVLETTSVSDDKYYALDLFDAVDVSESSNVTLTNDSTITINEAGRYFISVRQQFSSTGNVQYRLILNGSTTLDFIGSNTAYDAGFQSLKSFSASDYITITGQASSGSETVTVATINIAIYKIF